jgi:Acyl-CoA dehydrogenase, C-terminal domain
MKARAHTARLAYYYAAAKMLTGEPFKKEAAIAKLIASGAAMDNAREATQIFGGYGFMNEYPVGRFYRDAKILEIGEGTSEIQRILIARGTRLDRMSPASSAGLQAGPRCGADADAAPRIGTIRLERRGIRLPRHREQPRRTA